MTLSKKRGMVGKPFNGKQRLSWLELRAIYVEVMSSHLINRKNTEENRRGKAER
jgi:hypothetical protein